MAVPTSLTFKELQDLTQDQLQDILAAADMTLTKIKKYINLGYNDFVRRVKPITGSYDITTVADDAEYDIKAGAFLQITHARYIEDSDTEYGEPLRLYPGGFSNLPKQKTSGIPYYYWIRYGGDNTAQELGTVPIAATSDYTIRVWGYNLPTALSANSDIPKFHEAFHEALILWPVWKLCNAYAHKSRAIREKAREARTEYLEMVSDAKGDTTSFTLDDISTVDEYSENYGDF